MASSVIEYIIWFWCRLSLDKICANMWTTQICIYTQYSVELHFDMIFDFFFLLLTFELVVVRNVLRIVTVFNMRTKQMNKKRSNNNLQSFIRKCNVMGIKSNPQNMFSCIFHLILEETTNFRCFHAFYVLCLPRSPYIKI